MSSLRPAGTAAGAVAQATGINKGTYTSIYQPKLTNPEEVQEAIRGLKVSKAPGPKGIPNRALKHLPQRVVSFLVLIFNAILLTHHFPSVEARSSHVYT